MQPFHSQKSPDGYIMLLLIGRDMSSFFLDKQILVYWPSCLLGNLALFNSPFLHDAYCWPVEFKRSSPFASPSLLRFAYHEPKPNSKTIVIYLIERTTSIKWSRFRENFRADGMSVVPICYIYMINIFDLPMYTISCWCLSLSEASAFWNSSYMVLTVSFEHGSYILSWVVSFERKPFSGCLNTDSTQFIDITNILYTYINTYTIIYSCWKKTLASSDVEKWCSIFIAQNYESNPMCGEQWDGRPLLALSVLVLNVTVEVLFEDVRLRSEPLFFH